jgi:hypothetical protein
MVTTGELGQLRIHGYGKSLFMAPFLYIWKNRHSYHRNRPETRSWSYLSPRAGPTVQKKNTARYQ